MIEITKTIEWDMGHRVPNHKHKCRNPHGHRYRLEVTISGIVSQERGTSQEGMVHDFGDIKACMLTKICTRLDHCFMVSEEDPIFVPLAKNEAKDLNILIVPFIPTAENIVVWCYQQIHDSFPPHLQIRRVRLWETPTSCAEYIP